MKMNDLQRSHRSDRSTDDGRANLQPSETAADDGLANVRVALERVRTVLQRRPDKGLHDDAPATAQLEGGHARRRAPSRTARRSAPTCRPSSAARGEQVTPGLAVPRRRRVVRRDLHRDGCRGRGRRASHARSARCAAARTRAACSTCRPATGAAVSAGPVDVDAARAHRRADVDGRRAARAGRCRAALLADAHRGPAVRRRSRFGRGRRH